MADPHARWEAARIVQSHFTRGLTPTFGPVSEKLVEYGIARLRDGHKGHIVEPLAFLSVMKWLEGQEVNVKSILRGRLDSRGKAFEELVVLYLLRILRHPIPLSTTFDFRGTPPEWAHEPAQVVGCLDGSNVSVEKPQRTQLLARHSMLTLLRRLYIGSNAQMLQRDS